MIDIEKFKSNVKEKIKKQKFLFKKLIKEKDLTLKHLKVMAAMGIVSISLVTCSLWSYASASETTDLPSAIDNVPHTIKVGDTEIATVGSYGDAKETIKKVKEYYGDEEGITTTMVEPQLTVEAKTFSPLEMKSTILNVEDATKSVVNANRVASEPLFKVTVKNAMIRQESIPFKTITKKSSSLKKGKTKVKQEGVYGIKRITGQATIVNGQVVEEGHSIVEIVKNPVDKIVYKGTKGEKGVATGSFTYPVPSNHGGGGYGWRNGPFFGHEFHMGYDINTSTGSSIVAADGGTVITAGWHNSYGYEVVISHGNGLTTRYAHNSVLKVKVGEKVAKGQLIALAGSTGDSTGSHCHFEVRVNGQHVNPANYLPKN